VRLKWWDAHFASMKSSVQNTVPPKRRRRRNRWRKEKGRREKEKEERRKKEKKKKVDLKIITLGKISQTQKDKY
jgi:hypothetical protein